MSFVAKLTIAFAILMTLWVVTVTAFSMDDVAVERSLNIGSGNLVTTSGISVNDSTAGTFSVGSVKNISFIKRFWLTVKDMPWWAGMMIALFNGFMLLLLTILWIVKIVHGNG